MEALEEMISVSLTKRQRLTLAKEAKKQERKEGALARIFIVQGLRACGYQLDSDTDEDEEVAAPIDCQLSS